MVNLIIVLHSLLVSSSSASFTVLECILEVFPAANDPSFFSVVRVRAGSACLRVPSRLTEHHRQQTKIEDSERDRDQELRYKVVTPDCKCPLQEAGMYEVRQG